MTNTKIFNVFMFATGAAIGSLVTWRIMKTRCERLIQAEVDAFVDEWSQRANEPVDEYNPCEGDDEWEDNEDEDDDDEYFDDSIMSSYHDLAGKYKKNDEEGGEDEVPYINGPYVISPDEFGDGDVGHDMYYYIYYDDGVLADTWGVKMDIDETIGMDALDHFGDYAEETVHIRNERLRIDYEVTCDPRTYDEAMAD